MGLLDVISVHYLCTLTIPAPAWARPLRRIRQVNKTLA